MGIAHTRWVTHGGVMKENAHPQLSIHVLKEFLNKHDFIFYSGTDTEIIPNLIEYHMRDGYNFIEAAKMTFKRMEGQCAIVVLNNDGKMIAIRKEAPLAVGIGEGEFYFASDITAFLENTRNVVFLEEYDYG